MATFRTYKGKRRNSVRAEVCVHGVRQSETFPDMGRARAWAREIEAELGDRARGAVVHRTVRQALERYREEVTPRHRGARWEATRIGKFLGDPLRGEPRAPAVPFVGKRMADVTAADVATWRNRLLATLATESARREYGILRAVFAVAAREWGMLARSPFEDVDPPAEGRPRSRRVSEDEARAVCAALGYAEGARTETAGQFVAAAFLLAIETAMRKGELLSLDQASRRGRVLHLDRTKNGDERDVPLTTRAVALLELLPTEGYLFPVADGTADVLFRRAVRAAGLEDLHFHDSRREGTTRLAAHVDVMTLAKITGHRDVRVLQRVYYAPRMADVAELLP